MSEILINEVDDECRIAMVNQGVLQELSVELTSSERIKGNVYKGIVTQVHSALQAAFVNFGDHRNGFLSMDELNFKMYPSGHGKGGRDSIKEHLREGQEVLVQVIRESSENKGAALTTFLSLPGRYMVLMPNSKGGGVSKRVTDPEERERLKIFIESIGDQEHSVIVRTAGIGRDLRELKRDFDQLMNVWKKIESSSESKAAPVLLLEEEETVIRMFRDYFNPKIDEIWVDNPNTFQKVFQFLKEHEPHKQRTLKIHTERKTIFNHFDIEKQVENLSNRRVNLRSGGYLIIDQTEALVSIDVNSGKFNRGTSNSDTAFETNMEAASEIALQLRLRNLGGLIVIDFIDMEDRKQNQRVRDSLTEAMKGDKAQHTLGEISQFGLLELSRQRISQGYATSMEVNCPYCEGSGRLLSVNSQVNIIIRKLQDFAQRPGAQKICVDLPLDLTNRLLNEKRSHLIDLEAEFEVEIFIRADPHVIAFNDNHFKITYDPKVAKPEHPKESRKSSDSRRASQRDYQGQKSGGGRNQSNRSEDRPKERAKPSETEENQTAATTETPKPVETRKDDGRRNDQGERNDRGERNDESRSRDGENKKPAQSDRKRPSRPARRGKPAGVEIAYPLGSGMIYEGNEEMMESEEVLEITDRFQDAMRGKPGKDYLRITNPKFLFEVTRTAEKAPAAEVDDEAETEQAKPKKPSRSRGSKRKEEAEEAEPKTVQANEGESESRQAEEPAPKKSSRGRRGTSSSNGKSEEESKTAVETQADSPVEDAPEGQQAEEPAPKKSPRGRQPRATSKMKADSAENGETPSEND